MPRKYDKIEQLKTMQPNIISAEWREQVARLTEEEEQKNVPLRVPYKKQNSLTIIQSVSYLFKL